MKSERLDSRDGFPAELPIAKGGLPPTEFRIFSAGLIETTKGIFLFDDEAAASVMAEFTKHGTDLMIDWEHRSLAENESQDGRAAGWFVPEMRSGELWATGIKWTADAFEQLSKGEYRYFSPAFAHEEAKNRIMKLINVALTNLPATRRLDPLVAASSRSRENEMAAADLDVMDKIARLSKKLDDLDDLKMKCSKCKKMWSPSDAPQMTCSSCMDDLSKKLADDLDDMDELDDLDDMDDLSALSKKGKRLADWGAKWKALKTCARIASKLLKVLGAKTLGEAEGKLTAYKASHERVVALTAEVEQSKALARKAEAEKLVDEGVKAGKIPPAAKELREMLVADAIKGDDGLAKVKKLVETMVPVVQTTLSARAVDSPVDAHAAGAITEADKHVSKLFLGSTGDLAAIGEKRRQMAENGGEYKSVYDFRHQEPAKK